MGGVVTALGGREQLRLPREGGLLLSTEMAESREPVGGDAIPLHLDGFVLLLLEGVWSSHGLMICLQALGLLCPGSCLDPPTSFSASTKPSLLVAVSPLSIPSSRPGVADSSLDTVSESFSSLLPLPSCFLDLEGL